MDIRLAPDSADDADIMAMVVRQIRVGVHRAAHFGIMVEHVTGNSFTVVKDGQRYRVTIEPEPPKPHS